MGTLNLSMLKYVFLFFLFSFMIYVNYSELEVRFLTQTTYLWYVIHQGERIALVVMFSAENTAPVLLLSTYSLEKEVLASNDRFKKKRYHTLGTLRTTAQCSACLVSYKPC